MGKRQTQEINAGSMADIAFLLLIFFLVTTTMDVDSGLSRQLPPPAPDEEADQPPPIRERNVLIVLINKDNQLAVEGELFNVVNLMDKVKIFVTNPRNDKDLSDNNTLAERRDIAIADNKENDVHRYTRLIKVFGSSIRVSKGVVSLQNDRGTSYKMYIAVQNELVSAFNELRDELSQQTFGKKYNDLSEDSQKLVREIYPLSISEAEPRNIGG
ncbi:MAG: biopolymer transporter ExbD [Bacteroidales bacterium]|nr:biopolymer transporter ExbD [Bacteroidales bacterium]